MPNDRFPAENEASPRFLLSHPTPYITVHPRHSTAFSRLRTTLHRPHTSRLWIACEEAGVVVLSGLVHQISFDTMAHVTPADLRYLMSHGNRCQGLCLAGKQGPASYFTSLLFTKPGGADSLAVLKHPCWEKETLCLPCYIQCSEAFCNLILLDIKRTTGFPLRVFRIVVAIPLALIIFLGTLSNLAKVPTWGTVNIPIYDILGFTILQLCYVLIWVSLQNCTGGCHANDSEGVVH